MNNLLAPATDLSSIPAFVLAGGLNTPVRSDGSDVPSSVSSIAGRPFLYHQLEHLKQQGIRTVVVLASAMDKSIEQQLGDGASFGLRIRCVFEKELSGTGGALKNAASFLKADNFFVLHEQTFFSCNLGLLLSHHRQQKTPATIALKLMRDTAQYGKVELDAEYRITRFIEKTGETTEGFVNAGTYALHRSILESIPKGAPCSLDRDILPNLAVSGIGFADPLIDSSIPDDSLRASNALPLQTTTSKKKALFLDRDGVVNEDKGYPHRPEDIVFKPGIFDFCQKAATTGYAIVIVTNQAGVAKGMFSLEDVNRLHEWMRGQFHLRGITITGFAVCPFHERGTVPAYSRASLFRKPEAGMILEAAEEWGLDIGQSIMVGDKLSDRIRLPYLRSIILKSAYTESGYDVETLEDLNRTLFGP